LITDFHQCRDLEYVELQLHSCTYQTGSEAHSAPSMITGGSVPGCEQAWLYTAWTLTVCLSGELTRPWSRDVRLNAVLKTLPLTKKNVPTVRAFCMTFDTMGVLQVTRRKYWIL
jgi:hypothetical protein